MKGDWGDICNRKVCGIKLAYYYNRATRKYYCDNDALLINNANWKESIRLYGDRRLCVFISEADQSKRSILETKLSHNI